MRPLRSGWGWGGESADKVEGGAQERDSTWNIIGLHGYVPRCGELSYLTDRLLSRSKRDLGQFKRPWDITQPKSLRLVGTRSEWHPMTSHSWQGTQEIVTKRFIWVNREDMPWRVSVFHKPTCYIACERILNHNMTYSRLRYISTSLAPNSSIKKSFQAIVLP